jgi:plastocyanin
MRRVKLTAVLVLVLIAATAAVSTASAGEGPAAAAAKKRKRPVIVKVADDYFAPVRVRIRRGRRVRWFWSRQNFDSHNVRLTRVHPRGVRRRRFRSVTGTFGIRFIRRFWKPGVYRFVCTIHPAVMRMTVRVRR